MQEQLSEHLGHQPEIDPAQLQQQMQEHQAALQTQLEIRDQLKLKLELHQQNVAKQKQFADQIQAIQQEEHRWGKFQASWEMPLAKNSVIMRSNIISIFYWNMQTNSSTNSHSVIP